MAKRSRAQPFPVSQRGRKAKGAGSCDDPNRIPPAGMKPGHFRSRSTIKRLNMYRGKPDLEKMRERPTEPARIQPDRRWFNNTRVITQTKLAELREAVALQKNDPYQVQLKATKLPVSLFNDDAAAHTKRFRSSTVLACESFPATFGKNKQRKKARLAVAELGDLAASAVKGAEEYKPESDTLLVDDACESHAECKEVPEEIFRKGKSRRIWGELYKVIDSSDIIVHVLDARDPEGTRCHALEKHIKTERPHKKVILLLNKCDLIPSWVAARWTQRLAAEAPTVAFKASITRAFGKMTLISLLRQFAALMKDRKHVSVGFVGYPNVGKSSIINTLRRKEVCKTAPIPGETKIWQYVALTNRIYLIDCPGVVPADSESGGPCEKLLKGVVRAERVADPDSYLPAVLERCRKQDLIKRYKVDDWIGATDFLEKVAKKMGKLLKGGELDVVATAKIILFDWQRGRLPYYTLPPMADGTPQIVITENEPPSHSSEDGEDSQGRDSDSVATSDGGSSDDEDVAVDDAEEV